MIDPVLQPFLDSVRERLGVEQFAVRPSNSPDDPDVPWFIYLLGIPSERLSATLDDAWDLAFEIHGYQNIPFFLSAVTPSNALEHFPDEYKQSA